MVALRIVLFSFISNDSNRTLLWDNARWFVSKQEKACNFWLERFAIDKIPIQRQVEWISARGIVRQKLLDMRGINYVLCYCAVNRKILIGLGSLCERQRSNSCRIGYR